MGTASIAPGQFETLGILAQLHPPLTNAACASHARLARLARKRLSSWSLTGIILIMPIRTFELRDSARSKPRLLLLFALMLPALAVEAQVSALGRLEPLHGTLHLTAPVTPESTGGAVLRDLQVDVGDSVEAGQLLAVTETADLMQALVDETRAEQLHQQRQIAAAQAEARAACVQADVVEREAQRRQSLLERKLSSAEEAERARGDSQALKASCEAAQATASATVAGSAVVDARLQRVMAALQRTQVRAPVAGQVIEIHARPGEMIGPLGILALGRVDRMYAIAEVYETDIGQVRVGQTASVSSRALAEPLSGVVERVRPQVRKQDQMGTDPAARKDARIVEVEIRLQDSAPAAALTNLQVEITIGS